VVHGEKKSRSANNVWLHVSVELTMGSVVLNIRVEAAGVSLTFGIADGGIAIALAKDVPAPAAAPKLPHAGHGAAPASCVITESAASPRQQTNQTGLPNPPSPRTPPSQPSGRTKQRWSPEEIEQLKSLWPTHSASAIARQPGRDVNAIKSKIQRLKLKKTASPVVTAKPTPRAAAVPADSPAPLEVPAAIGACAVSLLDHRTGQCRWIVRGTGAAPMYCGAPVVDSSSRCRHHCGPVLPGTTGSGLAEATSAHRF
jgi:hypothetical protein